MSLDLYAGIHREHFAPQDEVLLQLASQEPDRFPHLAALWEAFHADPVLHEQQAGSVAHELLLLLTQGEASANPAWLRRGVALAAFFSTAARERLPVKCVSD